MRKRKLARISESDEEDGQQTGRSSALEAEVQAEAALELEADEDAKEANEEEDDDGEPAKPLGEIMRRTGRGRAEKCYYQAFELDGNRYELEDPVLITPEERNQKPYVAIIREIKQGKDGKVAITGQWFYRPEEAEKKGGGSWISSDSRELFYSFHRDEVPAESVMHKCVAHFIPPNKQAPLRSKHPGFVVRKVYDTDEKRLFKLTDKDYEDNKQSELDLLFQKTKSKLGELPDIEPEEASTEQDDTGKSRRQLRRASLLPINVNRDEHAVNEMVTKDGSVRPDTPASTLSTDQQGASVSEGLLALHKYNSLTGNKARDRWLEKLLLAVRHVCNIDKQGKNERKPDHEVKERGSEAEERGSQGEVLCHIPAMPVQDRKLDATSQAGEDIIWPQDAIPAVTRLERFAFETLNADLHKYNIKMRQLEFNLKNGPTLARRLLKKELDSSKVFNMSPAELKDGLTAEEKSAQEPEEPETMQMADVRCSICGEKQVGVRDIIHVGYGDRYQLECMKCGNSWYAARDSISSLRIETVNRKHVGTAPWATSKFEEVEREYTSPRESGRLLAQDETVQGNATDKQLKSLASPKRDGPSSEA